MAKLTPADRERVTHINRYIFQKLRQKELEPYYGANGTEAHKYALVEMLRETNKSIRRASEWSTVLQSGDRIEGKLPERN